MFNMYARVGIVGVFVTLFAGTHRASADLITFEGLTPGSTGVTTYAEGAYTFSSNLDIFVGFNFGAVTSSPFVFPSNAVSQFHLNARTFDLLSIDLGPLNGSVGPQNVTFIGTRAAGGTVSQSFTTGGAFAFQTFTFGSEFSDLVAVDWTPNATITDNINVFQGPTMTFDSLVIGSSQTTYSEDGFTINSANGDIFVGSNFVDVSQTPVIFGSHIAASFTLTADNGGAFDLFAIDLGELSTSQFVNFVGTLADGGTVSAGFFTPGGGDDLQTVTFGPEFSNLTSVTWLPRGGKFDNIVLGPTSVPEPGTLASLGLLVGTLAFRRRRVRQVAA